MTSAKRYHVVFVTAPDLKVARRLARAVLEAHLAACVNLVPGLESHYWWQGQLEASAEVLMILKTTRAKLKPLEDLVRQEHPYDTPEFLAFPLSSGSARYLAWLAKSVQA